MVHNYTSFLISLSSSRPHFPIILLFSFSYFSLSPPHFPLHTYFLFITPAFMKQAQEEKSKNILLLLDVKLEYKNWINKYLFQFYSHSILFFPVWIFLPPDSNYPDYLPEQTKTQASNHSSVCSWFFTVLKFCVPLFYSFSFAFCTAFLLPNFTAIYLWFTFFSGILTIRFLFLFVTIKMSWFSFFCKGYNFDFIKKNEIFITMYVLESSFWVLARFF